MYKKLAIIGTAGRKEDQGLLTADHYTRMIKACITFIQHYEINTDNLILVSGGAAWADHLVVSLALMGVVHPENLKLYLPANLEYYGYEGVPDNPFSQRVADTANYYHKLFSKKTGHNSIEQLLDVRKKGAYTEVIAGGFKARNSRVANDVSVVGTLLAFTFGETTSKQNPWTIRAFPPNTKSDVAGLKDGGTADTFNKTKVTKHHARLGPIENICLNI